MACLESEAQRLSAQCAAEAQQMGLARQGLGRLAAAQRSAAALGQALGEVRREAWRCEEQRLAVRRRAWAEAWGGGALRLWGGGRGVRAGGGRVPAGDGAGGAALGGGAAWADGGGGGGAGEGGGAGKLGGVHRAVPAGAEGHCGGAAWRSGAQPRQERKEELKRHRHWTL